MIFSTVFGTLAFLNPWVLAGLAFLPALWFLLRVTPPAPRLVVFPPARFFAELLPDEPTASRTPWWILLLRLLTLALILLALARPVLNPAAAPPGDGAIRLVIDNSWPAARTWDTAMDEALRLIKGAGRNGREIYILTTAPEPGETLPAAHGPLTQAQAESALRALRPRPWPADYETAVKRLEEQAASPVQSYWLGHGLKEGSDDLAKALLTQGGLHYIRPGEGNLPLLLRPSAKSGTTLSVLVSGPKTLPPGTPVAVNALGTDGRVLDTQRASLDVREKSAELIFDLPDVLRNQITQIRIAGNSGAGGVLLLDDRFKRRSVGIAAPSEDTEDAPLIGESYYIEKALAPFADLSAGTVTQLLEQSPSVMILPNTGALPPDELNALEDWVKKGGLLLRFAGPNMTQGDNFLVPVPLLQGGRAMDGALTWDEPAKLAPFPATSPLYGLALPGDVAVRRQLLADPAPGLEEKTWAALDDGTPLMTADRLGDGMIVLIHTTATPLWSDLPLSGLFVQILQRIVSLAGSSGPQGPVDGGLLNPMTVLDGFGAPGQPGGSVQPIPATAFETVRPGPTHPPGLYGRAGYQVSFNLGDRIDRLDPYESLPPGVETGHYGGRNETDLMPRILVLSFILFLADWVLMIVLMAGWRRLRFAPTALCLALILSTPPAHADTAQQLSERAAAMHLAYVRTGNADVDAAAQKGLESLSETLRRRTSVEPSGVVAVDPATTELAFFPFLYWPVTQEQSPLSAPALRNVQSYIDHGGTILFDTRDHLSTVQGPYGQSGGRNADKLQILVGSLDIPPLVPIGTDHVLTKSFYLISTFPGRYEGSTLWVEEQSASGHDGVSSIIIGGNDWASAWAATSGGSHQEEMALRFGVNLVMYALTGNYKADQVHLPHILERLGQ